MTCTGGRLAAFAGMDDQLSVPRNDRRSAKRRPMTQHTCTVAALILFAVGCDTVSIDAPIGAPVTPAERESVTGRWIDEESTITEVRQTKRGQLVAGSLHWDEENSRFVVENISVDLRRVGGVAYVFVQRKGETPKDGYLFGRVSSMTDDKMRIHPPKPEAFRTAVENGQAEGEVLSGKKDQFHVRLDAESRRNFALLSRGDLDALFHSGNDVHVLRRLSNGDRENAERPRSPEPAAEPDSDGESSPPAR